MFEKNIVSNQPHPVFGGSRIVYRFDNNYGAVRLKHGSTYGIELSVCQFKGEGSDEFETVSNTPLTANLPDGIFVWLEEEEVEPILRKISQL